MAAKSNSGGGGTHGVAVSAANSGGISGDAFTGTAYTGSSNVTFDTTYSTTPSFKVTSAAATQNARVYWNTPSSATHNYGRVELYFTAYPSTGNVQVCTVFWTSSGAMLVVTSTGALALYQYGGSLIASSSASTVPLNTWFRVEWDYKTTNAGSYDVRLYPSRTSTTADFTLSGSKTWAASANSTQVYFGNEQASEAGSFWFGHPHINDTALPGPYLGEVVAAPVVDTSVHTFPPTVTGLAVVKTNTADGGTAGVTVTEANSGGASGTAWDSVDAGSGAGVTYASISGALVYKFDGVGAPGYMSTYWNWPTDGGPKFGGRFDLRIASYTVTDAYAVLWELNRPTSAAIRLWVTDAGELRLNDSTAGSVALFTTLVGTNVWRRVEWSLDLSADTYDVRLYADRTTTTPLQTRSGSFSWSGTDTIYNGLLFGPQYITDSVIYLDNIEANNTGVMPGPWAAPAVVVAAPVADVDVDAPAPTVPIDITVAAPVADVDVHVFAPTPDYALSTVVAAPVATAEVHTPSLSLLEATLTLISPTADLAVPTLFPVFRTAVITDDEGARVEVQYDTENTFTDPVILTGDVPYGLPTTYVGIKTEVAMTDGGSYFWRARVVNDYDTTAWVGPLTFDISALDGDALTGGTWTVSATHVPYPHLWWTFPDRGRPGDTVVAIGTGFGPTTATVTISGETAAGDLRTVAGTADAYTEDRVIDRDNDHVDCDHMRVTFTVPMVGPPAGPLYVDGS